MVPFGSRLRRGPRGSLLVGLLLSGQFDAHLMKCRLKVMDVVVGDILEGGSGDDLDVVFEVG